MQTESPFPWRFFALTFALSWALWIPAAVIGQPALSLPVAPLYLLGGFGPSIVGIIFAMRDRDPSARREFWKRAFDFRRIRPAWYAWIFLFIPAVTAVSFLLGGATGLPEALQTALAQPAALVGTILITIFAGPLAEELGWRGYALDRLQSRWSTATAALILGVIWWAWHLPLFFIQGTSHNSWGIISLQSLLFFITVIPLSLFISMAYNQNNRSTLSAILIHWIFNLVFSLVFPVPQGVEVIRVGLLALVVGGLYASLHGWKKAQPAR